ncbi:pentapeptide repeat-containing protein [Campylobacter coli]|nr:pentapeptide repeat-containing protein [Campylobacter coli]
MNNEEDIKFENYIKGEAKLNSEKQYIIESSCYFDGNKDNFKRHYDENKILEIHLNNMVFEEDLSFDNVKKLSLIINDNVKFQRLCIFGCNELSLRINGRVKIIDKISINNCKFKQISINNHIDGNIEFQKCEFNDFDLYGFSNATIKGAFTFDFCELKEKVNFMNFEFENKVSFKMSKFKDNIYFNNSHFKDYAYFHECEFEKTACFYGVRFDKAPNFSQAIFKGNLNAVNANLNFTFDDLQERIKQEYEDFNKNIENKKSLDKFANDFRDSFRTFKNALIKDNNLLDASNFHKYELYCKELELKNKKGKTFKDVVDRWQLLFYRKLCDHHTNLILNLKWFIVIVGFFASILFALRYGDGNLMQFFNKDNDLLKILKNILNINALNDSGAVYLIAMYSFIGLFFVRTFFIFYYLVIFILMLAISPYNLFSMINFAIRHETNSFLENIIIIIYTLSMVLIIFSLQKTARKNSIVPS